MKKIALLLITSIILMGLCGCGNKTMENSNDSNISNESEVEASGYTGYTNFVKKQDSGEYVPILDDLEYNGGEFDLDVEIQFEGFGKKAEFIDALAMLFVDGYMQEFSLDNDENALVHKITIQNKELMYINYKSVLTTYDVSSKEHIICAVILPYWELGWEDFIRDNAVMAKTRKIKLNTVNQPVEDYIIQMNNREKTDWDTEHSELPFKRGETNTDLTFHCDNVGETCCYVFCGGELFSQDGRYIFESSNADPNMTAFQDITVDESDVGKSLFVLSVPQHTDSIGIRNTFNYLWR